MQEKYCEPWIFRSGCLLQSGKECVIREKVVEKLLLDNGNKGDRH